MSISKIIPALPLVLGIACSTTASQSSDRTGAMWTERKGAIAQAQGTSGGSHDPSSATPTPGSSDTGSSTGSSGSADTSGSMGTGSAGSGSAGSDTGTMGQGSPSDSGSGSQTSTGSPGATDQGPGGGSMGGTSDQGHHGARGGQERGATGGMHGSAGGDTAHSDDQTVMGKLSKVSRQEISITPKGGEPKTLKVVKETIVTINGKDAKPSQLKQGQQVRASYNQQGDDDVAVKIEVGRSSKKARGGSGMQRGHMDSHSGQRGAGEGGSSGSSSGTGGSR